MARRNVNNTIKYEKRTGYIQGNAVRKLQVAEPYSNDEKSFGQLEEEHRRKKEQQRRIRRANKMNFLYTMAVTAVAAVIFIICYQYLNLQATVKNNAAAVAELEVQLNTLTSENEEMAAKVEAEIDYDAIYDTAVNELGMVYPKKGQVIRYAAGESEYVKQYQDIPNAE